MEQRLHWVEVTFNPQQIQQTVNLRWKPYSNGFRFSLLSGNSINKEFFNHFEFHPELTSKSGLLSNILIFTEQCKENAFNFVPITFRIDLYFDNEFTISERNIGCFQGVFNALEELKEGSTGIRKSKGKKSILVNSNAEGLLLRYTKYTLPSSHFIGQNLWLLKPSQFNRGRGIHIFNNIQTMKDIIAKQISQTKPNVSINSFSFVIQKYIERPLLINRRKFDIRMWVLLTHLHEFYLFREGYIRTTSVPFSTDTKNINDKFVHLTNNAIQKQSNSYSQYEDGNQLSFSNFRFYISSTLNSAIDFDKEILPSMKNIVKKSMYSVRKRLDSENRKYSFEIFGYDFILYEDYNVWLIEVNTNPCLEESSKLLKSLIPRMLDDAFKLTIDTMFPINLSHEKIAMHSVSGYKDDVNMWYY